MVAIHRLDKDIPCLIDGFNAKDYHGAACWVAGWGASRYGGRSERRLQSIGLNLMDVDFCRTHSFYDSHILQTDELCAGLPPNDESNYNIYDEKVINADKDSCQGEGSAIHFERLSVHQFLYSLFKGTLVVHLFVISADTQY